ncbi:MAG: glycosyltransferase family 4 protein [Sphingomonadales bacterium]|nr:glycosyltransferase family 4 protein [Sphingomonadales bacterium]
MKVLHLHSSFNPGGKELPGALGAAGAVDSSVSVDYPTDFPALTGRPSVARLRAIAAAMAGFDLVLTYNWGAIDAVMARRIFAGKMALPPLVHHEDGFNQDEAAGLKWQRNLFRRLALPGAAALVVPSRVLERIALETWHQPANRVRRIANGIPLAEFAHPPRADALPGLIKRPGDLWLGTMAGLRAVKNLPRLVRAFAAMPRPWQLVIVGDGPERDAILAEAARLGLSDRVHLPGHAIAPAAVMGLFDLFALSSDSEQFPISVVEAMACGLAVVSPGVGDVAAMVAPDNADWITASGDHQALGSALAEAAADPVRRERIGTANLARATAEYGDQAMIAAYRQLYATAMQRDAFP